MRNEGKGGEGEGCEVGENERTFNVLLFSGCQENGKSYRFGETITREDKCEKW